jgi:hypothetical protein
MREGEERLEPPEGDDSYGRPAEGVVDYALRSASVTL